ncbi:MAG: DNA internalization-related competence protein ComEC/Rec2 [Nocardioidaceae bacterium]
MPRLPEEAVPGGGRLPDLRAMLLGLSGWLGGLVALGLPGAVALALLAAATVVLVLRGRRGKAVVTGLACLLAAASVGAATAARVDANRTSAVAVLAHRGAVGTLTGTVTSDPVTRSGRFGDYTLTRMSVSEALGRGVLHRTGVPVLVIADRDWAGVRLGARVRVAGRLGPASGADLAGVLSTGRPPTVLSRPGDLFAGAEAVRRGIRASVAWAPTDARSLVPALVVGDDQQMSPQVVEDFRTCGLTHLAAVSGTNLTLVVGFLLVLARWAGVRARGLVLVGTLGVLGFVLLARPEPSVLRAAAMGSVALVGMGSRGQDRGIRALGVAVFALLLLDPWLVLSPGFVLSSLATAGILLIGPPFRDALGSWLPRWAAESLAVPIAAQLACTPVVAAISGQVSLVAVLANLVVAVVIGPATVLGLVGGVVVLAVPPLGHACGWGAGLCASWVITVATHLARLPTAAVRWPVGVVSLGVLVLLCAVIGLGATPVLRRGRWSVTVCVLLVVVMLRPLPSPGWPPRDWVLVACDVGQGDGLVLNAGGGSAVVVDTGPDPDAMDRCLRRLGVHALPVVVLTHFHADHIDGLPAVLGDHHASEIDVTATEDPAYGAEQVHAWARSAGVTVRVPAYGEVRQVGALRWQVIGPVHAPGSSSHGEEGSTPNNASLVLLVEVRGVRILMSGDMEPEAQQALARSLPGLRVDVLKVPHHGSRYQDPDLLAGLGARLALVSVGKDNDYGHPASATMALLRRSGMTVERTDQEGDVAVTVRQGALGVRTHRSP